MVNNKVSIQEMIKNSSYQIEYDSYIGFIRRFVKLFINRCNVESKNQYISQRQNLIKMMKEKYKTEFQKRFEDNKENRLFLEELLNCLPTNMDNIFNEELSKTVFNKTSSGILLNAMNSFRSLKELDNDFAILRKKTVLHLPYYDFARLDSFYNSLRSLSSDNFSEVHDKFLSKTINRFLIIAPYTSNYLVNNKKQANKYIAEFNRYLEFINKEAETFVMNNGKDSKKQYNNNQDNLLMVIIDKYTAGFIKRWGTKTDEMFLWELVNGMKSIFEELAKRHYNHIMSEMAINQAAYQDKATQRSEYKRNSLQINRTKRNVRRSL